MFHAHGLRHADHLSKLSDVAEGLHFLHSCNVIHEDLKGVRDCHFPLDNPLTPAQSNILVDATGRARITDFGLAVITQNLESIRCASAEHGNSARWIAPEILDDRGTYSKGGDVFSFAMVAIEVRCRSSTQADKVRGLSLI